MEPVRTDGGPDAPALGADRVVAGGATRAESVRAGLVAVPDDAAIIVVHDAARPLATGELFASVVGAVRVTRRRGAIPVLPVADTLKRVVGDTVQHSVDREGLVAVQTPQAFDAGDPARGTPDGPRPPTTPGWWRTWAPRCARWWGTRTT